MNQLYKKALYIKLIIYCAIKILNVFNQDVSINHRE